MKLEDLTLKYVLSQHNSNPNYFLHIKVYAVNGDVSVSGILSNKVKTDSMKSGSTNHKILFSLWMRPDMLPWLPGGADSWVQGIAFSAS